MKPGRKPKAHADRHSVHLRVGFTPSEAETVRAAARAAEVPVATLVRESTMRAVTPKAVPDPCDEAAWRAAMDTWEAEVARPIMEDARRKYMAGDRGPADTKYLADLGAAVEIDRMRFRVTMRRRLALLPENAGAHPAPTGEET